jgi:hypothetical protein
MAADGYAQTAFPDRDAELLEVASMAPPIGGGEQPGVADY